MIEYLYPEKEICQNIFTLPNPEKEKSFAGKQHIVTKCVSLGRHKEPYCAATTTGAPAFSFGPN